MEQRYLAVKLVEVREPGHSLTLRTLRRALAAADGGSVRSDEGAHPVTALGPGAWRVGAGEAAVVLVFEG